MTFKKFLKLREEAIAFASNELGEFFNEKELGDKIVEYRKKINAKNYSSYSTIKKLNYLLIVNSLHTEIKKELNTNPYDYNVSLTISKVLEKVRSFDSFNFLSKFYYKRYPNGEQLIHNSRENVVKRMEKTNMSLRYLKKVMNNVKKIKTSFEKLIDNKQNKCLSPEEFHLAYTLCYEADYNRIGNGFDEDCFYRYKSLKLRQFFEDETYNSMKTMSTRDKDKVLNYVYENLSLETLKEDYNEFLTECNKRLKKYNEALNQAKEKQVKKLSKMQEKIDCIKEVDLTF